MESVSLRIDAQVTGIEKAVRGLNLMDKKVRRRAEMRVKTIVVKIAGDAEKDINSELSSPRSGAGIKLGTIGGRAKKPRPASKRNRSTYIPFTRSRLSVISVKYKTSKISGSFLGYRISDTGGAPGRVAAVAEFAKNSHQSSQGAALVASMDRHFGARSGGRLVYRKVDDGLSEIIAGVQKGVDEACTEIERIINSA